MQRTARPVDLSPWVQMQRQVLPRQVGSSKASSSTSCSSGSQHWVCAAPSWPGETCRRFAQLRSQKKEISSSSGCTTDSPLAKREHPSSSLSMSAHKNLIKSLTLRRGVFGSTWSSCMGSPWQRHPVTYSGPSLFSAKEKHYAAPLLLVHCASKRGQDSC